MIAWFKRRFELRRRRAESRRQLERPGFTIKHSGRSCHLCGEETFGIHPIISKTSPAGETFRFFGRPCAHACLRCQMVDTLYSDCSGTLLRSPAEWGTSTSNAVAGPQ